MKGIYTKLQRKNIFDLVPDAPDAAAPDDDEEAAAPPVGLDPEVPLAAAAMLAAAAAADEGMKPGGRPRPAELSAAAAAVSNSKIFKA